MNEVEQALTLNELPGLRTLLNEGSPNQGEALCENAVLLLEQTGVKTHVNGADAVATRYACQVTDGQRIYYARLARFTDPPEEHELPLIVFDNTADVTVETANPLALRFKDVGGQVFLYSREGAEPIMDHPEYLALGSSIINTIAKQHMNAVAEQQAAREARRGRVRRAFSAPFRYFFDEDDSYAHGWFGGGRLTHGERRRRILGSVGLALAVFYGPQAAVGFDDIDAKAGPIPLPQPIEALVDWNNAPDHTAQGFSEPKRAVPIGIGDHGVEIPVNNAYNTTNAPDATNVDTSVNPDINHGEESRPGLYEIDFDYLPKDKDETRRVIDSEGDKQGERCISVKGDYREDETKLFTQDGETGQRVRARVEDFDTMKLCVDEEFTGQPLEASVFVWQDK